MVGTPRLAPAAGSELPLAVQDDTQTQRAHATIARQRRLQEALRASTRNTKLERLPILELETTGLV